MLYDLKNPLDRERFKRRYNALFQKQGIVELSERVKRSSQSNRYLHLIIGYLAMETGNTLEYAKEVFYKRTANKEIFVREKEDEFLGKTEYLRSSAELTQDEFSLSIDRFRDWSSQTAGIYLPSPNEEQFLESIEFEMNRHQRWM
ncbi:MAG: hypothetical protein IKW20_03390 [Bacteroidales bacterium]|nr:hypothetical protein [Bacteroidales bacterium]